AAGLTRGSQRFVSFGMSGRKGPGSGFALKHDPPTFCLQYATLKFGAAFSPPRSFDMGRRTGHGTVASRRTCECSGRGLACGGTGRGSGSPGKKGTDMWTELSRSFLSVMLLGAFALPAFAQPVFTCEDVKQISAEPAQSPRERCLATQKAKLEACTQQKARERAACEAGAKALVRMCEAIRPEADMAAFRAVFAGACGGR